MAKLTFCGAAGTVTGSCSLIETGSHRFLIDCGLFQGSKTTQELNYESFPFDPTKIDFLLLTHAHIDHSGLLPKLVKQGFKGRIYATEPTYDLLKFMLPDSAHIQESGVKRHNTKRRRRGLSMVKPIYTIEDAEATLKLFNHQPYESWFGPEDGIKARFWNAGHLLGSASIELQIDEGNDTPLTLLFSGDLGPEEKVFHPGPDAPVGYDYIVCESTYGNRDRDDYTLARRRAAIRDELVEALGRGGNVVIPSFAVERSQELLHDIGYLLANGEIPQASVYLDSPMARRATEVFMKYAGELEDVEVDEEKLFRHEQFHLVQSLEESKAVNAIKRGAIIISASGMCNAGRIKHHLRYNIHRPECTVLFVGYQSPGTLGHIISSGAKEVRIHGATYKVRANIRSLGNYSAHADQQELLDWILARCPINGGLFLNHGEDDARAMLRDLLGERGLDVERIHMPTFDETYELKPGTGPLSKGVAEPRLDLDHVAHDWHNDYAEFMIGLTQALERSTDREKYDLIAQLKSRLPQ
ncbi:MBL fold metallo-hydrolase [Rhodopirellula sp. MGV]|uniref:MBL fold metallo-hydrolase n=1 Tax=Rhodopirellula sp. MGV TaxID=2023130 RepID=UPI000B95F82C|nr:MBL fold metallo-hydrolase [Rhodopirellula sp. MGV]OYP28387.1 MBL fold metallo-hydrolase [Rhodopirellula sp. MGV]PNY38738.1 MBL fold metallo-hydrolase [Rhodopirellula baltica]